jgi:DNA polymerase-3 subunit alpha
MTKQYVNWHAHSYGSLLDGASRPEEYFQRAIEIGCPAATFTDHGNVHILLDAYERAKSVGLKFLPGEEFYQARKTRFDRDPEERAGKATSEWDQRGPYHLGVIAYNNAGYHNLIKLSSRAYLEGYFVKPRIDHELLAQHSDGLVLLSGCLSGEVQQALSRGDFDFALNTAAKMQDIVGKGNYFIEMQDHGIEEELKNHEGLKRIAKMINAPIIASCDSHYTHKDSAYYHDAMLCINTGSRIHDENRFKFSGDHFYLKSYDEMLKLFPAEYLDNTLLIYDKYDLNLKFDEYHFPQFKIPSNQSVDEYFNEMVYLGAQMRYGCDWKNNTSIVERLEYEMGVIKQMGFPNYFLVVADIVNWAKKNGILVGPGRGSAAGSLVSFVLKITEVDPLKYGLPFERFLVPGRKSMPDIDLDIDDRFREDVIAYTRQKYGHDHTAQICTFSEMGAKKAVRDVARVLNYPYDLGDRISKAMPPALFGVTKTLDECLETSEFRALYDADKDVQTVVDTAKQIEGLWRDSGIHAAGLIVADRPITDYIPVMQKGVDAPIVSQWDMHKVEKCGLLKIDFLGLRNLSIIGMCMENIKETLDVDIKNPYDLIDDKDQKTFDALSRGENIGVFQLESSGIRELLVGVKPEDMQEISAILALYRPGPMGSNVHNEYVARKYKKKPITYLHPSLKNILNDTYGLLLYQEQLLKIATSVAGFTSAEADDLRKAVGKKNMEQMTKQKVKFISGCISHSNLPKDIATKLFNEIEHHASYSFSLNHAVSYAFTSYVTSYLRTHYPAQYMAAALSTVQDNKQRLQLYLNECKRLGISVLPPSVNYSDYDFKLKSNNEIVYGFSAIKGIGETITNQMISSRSRKYENIFDFMRSVDNSILNKKILEHFTSAGCFDDLLENSVFDFEDINRGKRLQVLYSESEELGVFLSDHPFNEIDDLIQNKVTHVTKDLYEMTSGQMIRIAGVVVDFERKITRSGKKMYKMRLEDLHGSIAVDIMPTQAEKMPDQPFAKGEIIVVYGRLDRFSDDENASVNIIFSEAEKINTDFLTGGRPIILKTNKQLSFDNISKINDIIHSTKGNSPVFLEFDDNGNEVRIKFNDLTSKDIEDKLKFLIGVI